MPESAIVKTATAHTLWRSYRSRKLADQGASRQQVLLSGAEALARAYARQLTPETTHLFITQSLLPYLWRDGHLGGRTFEVLMTRLPLYSLHETLDNALKRFPERTTLGDFRAPHWLIQAEQEALQSAQNWITPHSDIAKIAPEKTVRLEWAMPSPCATAPKGNLLLFLGPTVARKGAFEVREAIKRGGWELVVLGRDLEGEGFWNGLPVEHRARSQNFWEGISCVVQPALIEDKPRLLPIPSPKNRGFVTRKRAYGVPLK